MDLREFARALFKNLKGQHDDLADKVQEHDRAIGFIYTRNVELAQILHKYASGNPKMQVELAALYPEEFEEVAKVKQVPIPEKSKVSTAGELSKKRNEDKEKEKPKAEEKTEGAADDPQPSPAVPSLFIDPTAPIVREITVKSIASRIAGVLGKTFGVIRHPPNKKVWALLLASTIMFSVVIAVTLLPMTTVPNNGNVMLDKYPMDIVPASLTWANMTIGTMENQTAILTNPNDYAVNIAVFADSWNPSQIQNLSIAQLTCNETILNTNNYTILNIASLDSVVLNFQLKINAWNKDAWGDNFSFSIKATPSTEP